MAEIRDEGVDLKVIRDANTINFYNKRDGSDTIILFARVEKEQLILKFNGVDVETLHFADNDQGLPVVEIPDCESFDDLLDKIQGFISGISPEGIEAFFLEARGSFGTGAGWADSGFIANLPVLLFAQASTERAIYMFYALARILLTTIDPQVSFIVYSTGAPGLGNEDIVWQLETRYIAENEDPGKVADETLLKTQSLTNFVANERQSILTFILDRSLITDQDVLMFTLERLGGNGSDTYNSDAAVGQAGIVLKTLVHNP